jgi:hypothetical protein
VTELAVLTEAQRGQVRAAVAAVEVALEPVAASAFPALADPALRAAVAAELCEAGRELIEVAPRRWLSGYADDIADRLFAEGLGVLEPEDRAVLALVLIYSVAIPRARGRIHASDWTKAEPVALDELKKNRNLSASVIDRAVRRLKAAAVLEPGHKAPIQPGLQFLRLTHERSSRIWEELLLVAQPHGPMANLIRRRRAEREQSR